MGNVDVEPVRGGEQLGERVPPRATMNRISASSRLSIIWVPLQAAIIARNCSSVSTKTA